MELDIALAKGCEAYKNDELRQADHFFTQILGQQPSHPLANYYMANIAIDIGKLEIATAFLKTAVRADPSREKFWAKLIETLLIDRKFAEVKRYLEEAKFSVSNVSYNKLLITATKSFEFLNFILDQSFPSSHAEGLMYKSEMNIFDVESGASFNLNSDFGALEGPIVSADQVNSVINLFNAGRYSDVVSAAGRLTEQFVASRELLNVYGAALQALGKHREAIHCFQAAIELASEYPQPYYNLGLSLAAIENYEQAIQTIIFAISLKSDYTLAYLALGDNLQRQRKFIEAIASYKRAIQIDPNFTTCHNNLGNLLYDLGGYDDAILAYEKALEIDPNQAVILNNLGTTLKKAGNLQGAMQAYQEAICLEPKYAEAHCNLGTVLDDQGKLNEAVESYQRAIFLQNDYADAYYNLGIAFEHMGDFDAALEAQNNVLKIDRNYVDAEHAKSHLFLAQKKFELGWSHYEKRWSLREHENQYLSSNRPNWSGLSTGNILLWSEQGLGDVVMFSSIISELLKKVNHLIIQIDERLIPLFERSFPTTIDFYPLNVSVPEELYEYHLPFGSLPLYFRPNIDSFTRASGGFLKPNKVITNDLKKKILKGKDDLIIGLSWKGGNKRDCVPTNKSICLREFAKILPKVGVTFVNLQYGDTIDELREFRDLTGIDILSLDEIDNFNNIDGLSSLIAACDHVITVDNITAYLSGAVGKSASVLLPVSSHWRWGLADTQSYWHSSLSLYRQNTPGSWEYPLEQLKEALRALLKLHGTAD